MPAPKNLIITLILFTFALILYPSVGSSQKGFCSSSEGEGEGDQLEATSATMANICGGIHDFHSSNENSGEIDGLAQFAVQQHNTKENALLEFVRVVKAQEQVVAGTMHHLTVEVIDAGKKKLYAAKIWVKPWMNFKEVQEFKHIDESPSLTSSDLGAKTDGHARGWQSVPAHDPVVQDAAHHAVKIIQQRSNSLFPYVLQEVVDAKSEVVDEFAKINMVIKVKRGEKEERFKVEVHKNNEGAFSLNQMELHAHED